MVLLCIIMYVKRYSDYAPFYGNQANKYIICKWYYHIIHDNTVYIIPFTYYV